MKNDHPFLHSNLPHNYCRKSIACELLILILLNYMNSKTMAMFFSRKKGYNYPQKYVRKLKKHALDMPERLQSKLENTNLLDLKHTAFVVLSLFSAIFYDKQYPYACRTSNRHC